MPPRKKATSTSSQAKVAAPAPKPRKKVASAGGAKRAGGSSMKAPVATASNRKKAPVARAAKAAPARAAKTPSARAKSATPGKPTAKQPHESVEARVEGALDWLRRHATKATRDGMARYAIPADNALGVKVGDIRALGKQLGRSHELAAALWETGCYEARMLASFVAEPARLTPAEMERWCRQFDSWAICDTMCFHLFDRTPHAWKLVEKWSGRREEFVKRAAFALLASLVVHDKRAADALFVESLPLVERAAEDERNFVKKSVNWALRTMGKRSAELNAACVVVARRLADSAEAAPRWVGKDALRELTSPAVVRRLSKKRSAA